MANSTRLEDVDFGINKGETIFMMVLVTVVFGGVIYFAFPGGGDDITWLPESGPLRILAIFAAFLLPVAFLFYAALGPYRRRFTEEGIYIWKWGKWRLYRWDEVTDANLFIYKSRPNLTLNYGGIRSVYIALDSYKRSRSLLEEINGRLPVDIEVSESDLARIRDQK